MHKFQPLFIAIQFLTRIPVPQMHRIDDKDIGRSLLYYPLVGFIIGVFLLAVAWISSGTSSLVSAALVLSTWVLITGALHIDGLADSADAWIGGQGNVERSLEIMKDPRAGPIAVVVLILVLLLKFAAIEAIIAEGELMLLLIAPVIGRAFMPLLLMTTPYVRSSGLASAMTENLPSKISIYALLLLCAIFSLTLGPASIIFASLICFLLLRKLMIKRLGGMTGDTAGALLEIIEMVVLVTIAFSY